MIAIQSLRNTNKSIESSFGLLIFLQAFALVLCFGGPLSIFAPVPIILALLVYGRIPTLFFAGLIAAVVWYAMTKVSYSQGFILTGIHLVAVFSGLVVAEVIFRNMNPVKGLIISGLVFVSIVGGLLFFGENVSKGSTKNQISLAVEETFNAIQKSNKDVLDQGTEEARNLKEIISSKNELVENILNYLPSIIFVSSFFTLWISLYSALRLSKVWRYKNLYSFGTRDLLTFKTPEFFVYPLIVGLVLTVGASFGMGKQAQIIGENLLFCLGVFYLFQGFGIFNDFLTFAKIGGIFKSAIMAFALMALFKYLAIVGMFDLWFDFRKYFTRNKNDEGDML